MRTIIIDGREMTSRANAHALLAERLSFPAYYGRNLDALHDCLGDISEDTHLIIHHCSELEAALGADGTALLNGLLLAAGENSFLTISFYDTVESFDGDLTEHKINNHD